MNDTTMAMTAPASDTWRRRLLFWTGIATMLPGLQFVLPTLVLRAMNIDVGDPAGMFYARHWALMAFCIGALLVYAARHPQARPPILLAAVAEKFGLVLLVALAWNEPALAGLRGAAIFDGLCVLLYLPILWRGSR